MKKLVALSAAAAGIVVALKRRASSTSRDVWAKATDQR